MKYCEQNKSIYLLSFNILNSITNVKFQLYKSYYVVI